MEYENIKDWLDKLVDNRNEAIALTVHNASIWTTTCDSERIQLYKGIDIVAGFMGLQLEEKYINDEYPHMYTFRYRDVEFVQLSGKKLK